MLQTLIHAKCIRSDKFESIVDRFREDFIGQGSRELKETLKRLNEHLKLFSFEIKSVVTKEVSTSGSEGRFIYHVFANTESDAIATESGNILNEQEINVFKKIIECLLKKSFENTAALLEYKGKWTAAQMETFLETLEYEKWLVTDDRGLWKLSPRTYVELRSVLETLVLDNMEAPSPEQASASADDDSSSARQALLRLPQLLYY